MNLPNELPFRIEYKREKKIFELDPKVFRICDIKEHEIGRIKKRPSYIHFNGKSWSLLIISGDEVRAYKIEPKKL